MSAVAIPKIVASRYAPKEGARLRNEDASKLGMVMERLEKSGHLQPSELVKVARSARSPIHHLWNWDIQAAAEAHWLNRAAYFMRSVVLRVEYDSGETEDVRAFHVIRSEEDDEEPEENNWYALQTVQTNQSYSTQILDQAKDELAAFDRKWRQYRRFLSYEKKMGRAHKVISEILKDD